jgi:hypothetical protein
VVEVVHCHVGLVHAKSDRSLGDVEYWVLRGPLGGSNLTRQIFPSSPKH